MEEQERISRQMLKRNRDDTPSARKPRMSVSDEPFRLKAPPP